MSQGWIPIESFKIKLYQKENRSKGFSELSEERLAEIAKMIYKRNELLAVKSYSGCKKKDKLENYVWTLRYLIDSNIHAQFPEYDERIAFLIMNVDPELYAYKEYLKINIPSMSKIQAVRNSEKRQLLMEERMRAITLLERNIREKIGFYDAKLLKYEEMFFRRFYGNKELVTEVGQNKSDEFALLTLLASSLDVVSRKRYLELVDKADIWLSLVDSSKHKSKIAMYSVLRQKDLIDLRTHEEQIIFYILVVDPNLEMLKIYEEESMIPFVKARIMEKFGFFNLALINYERELYYRFCPDKEVSIWLKK